MIVSEGIFVFNFLTHCFLLFSETSATFCCWTMIPDKPRLSDSFSLIFSRIGHIKYCLKNIFLKVIMLLLRSAISTSH